MSESIIGRARKKGAIEVECHQLRDYAFDKHKRVDDTTYGGGMGMLMKAEPIALCFEAICEKLGTRPHFIYMSPKGRTLTQSRLRELSQIENICILCKIIRSLIQIIRCSSRNIKFLLTSLHKLHVLRITLLQSFLCRESLCILNRCK